MPNNRVHPGVLAAFLLLAGATDLAAAPGKLGPTGPFGVVAGPIRELAFPSADPGRMLVLTGGDLYETRDHGVNWRSVLVYGPDITPEKLIVDPADPDHWYVAGLIERQDTVIETRNAGRGWSTLAVPATSLADGALTFFLDAAAPSTLLASYDGFGDSEYFISQDGGATWIRRQPPAWPGTFLGIDRGRGFTQQFRFDLASGVFTPNAATELRNASWVAFDRERADTLFATVPPGGRFFKSTDGGATFTSRDGGGRTGFSQSARNPDHLAASRGTLRLSFDRGDSWIELDAPASLVQDTAFDPATDELAVATDDGLLRRRADGSLSPMPLNGLSAVTIDTIAVRGELALMRSGTSNLIYARDAEGSWRPRGKVQDPTAAGGQVCFGASTLLLLPGDPLKAVIACATPGVFTTDDGGWTWTKATGAQPAAGTNSFLRPPTLGRASGAGGEVLYLLFKDQSHEGEFLYRSTDLGRSWDWIRRDLREVAIHPEAARGVVAVKRDASLERYSPEAPVDEQWEPVPGTAGLFSLGDPFTSDVGFGHDPAHPDLIYGITETHVVRSDDFGSTWEAVASVDDAFDLLGPYPYPEGLRYIQGIVIDPFDSDHWLIPDSGLVTRDGGRTFAFAKEAEGSAAAFDPLVPGHFMTGDQYIHGAGVYERRAVLPACPDSAAAWCARGGRYLLTVDWKDPQGVRGKAVRVDSGSEDSGLFYFFDPNNWELLVKVLDGCGLNQRFWLLAAGTTDVEYVMKVEDRWTGQIRHYANAGGQAAPAVIDTDAFAGCGAAAPPGAAPVAAAPASLREKAGGETSLLLSGRFEVKTRWTDFAGAEGDALTAPLRSDSSGLFYFFSPDNWEMLVKVLNGCAINNHYWVLAAASTDVGYRMTVRETTTSRSRLYQNPVGRAAPALLDLQAFSCPAGGS